jgi:site-specific DNA-cytosine methylase
MAIFSFLSVVEELLPNYVMLENVPSISPRYVMFLQRCLLDLGYQCRIIVLQGNAYGVPQSRTR